ncbi:phosphoglycerate kinase [Cellulomonas xiejunii]|uniref:phosphoglycerate kinase n=1 Tax=Cellulomonas xiejunii TaxID=2968083 RepID=UPI001D0E8972|nr:phosphoglycerate kinase [Cellulomonas xiejunii]MCC2314015.1 phosphoglycerate kinase [Cellulomonas xiejunii]
MSRHHTQEVPRLSDCTVARGDRWIYVAGCNVAPRSTDVGRIDCEVDDLRRLLDRGARVAILTHQGSAADGSAVPVPHVAARLSDRLGRTVAYHPTSTGPAARARAAALHPGDAVVLGNVRLDPREQQGSGELADEYAQLGDAVAVGAFSRAHRRDASNHALLTRLPSHAATALLAEVEALAPWAAGDPGSVAILGGVKREKTTIALAGFVETHALVLPGGAVLHALLEAAGNDIGDSSLGEDPSSARAVARDVLARRADRILLPRRVVTRELAGAGVQERRVVDGVPAGWAIVDHVVPDEALTRLRELGRGGGRALLAGTPGLVTAGHVTATRAYAAALEWFGDRAMLLGGDTVQDVPFAGRRSTGGGSALRFLVDGELPVLQVLALRQQRAVAS